jgi:hypothetical protein
MDETCWCHFEAPRKILEEIGKETVKLRSKQNKEPSFTASEGIRCSGNKLSLWVIAKGKTARMEARFGTHPQVIMKYPESGWPTNNLIVQDLHWLQTETADGCPCLLILDLHPVQRTEAVVFTAEECDTEFLFVLAGGTSECQLLDCRIPMVLE